MSSPATPMRDMSLDLTGASIGLFPLDAYNSIQERYVHNPNAANPIAINLTGAAAVINGKGSITLAAGAFWSGQVTSAITVIGTNGDHVTAGER